MNKHDPDGGYAFPWTIEYNDGSVKQSLGMTTRDYFAAKVVSGWLATFSTDAAFPEEPYLTQIAEAGYKLADAMLKVRRDAAGDERKERK